jgi:hypothetical protein
MPICSAGMLDHALGEVGGLGPAGAAIGSCLRRIGEQPLHTMWIVCTS